MAPRNSGFIALWSLVEASASNILSFGAELTGPTRRGPLKIFFLHISQCFFLSWSLHCNHFIELWPAEGTMVHLYPISFIKERRRYMLFLHFCFSSYFFIGLSWNQYYWIIFIKMKLCSHKQQAPYKARLDKNIFLLKGRICQISMCWCVLSLK